LQKLQTIQVEARINAVRQMMRDAGMQSLPEVYQQALGPNGESIRDYRGTLENLNRSYEDFVRDRRLTANWGENYQALRIGNSKLTVQEFESRTLSIQQQSANEAYDRGKLLIATGQLRLRNDDYVLTLGAYVDDQVRRDLRLFGKDEGLVDSRASSIFAVNRYIQSNGIVGIPDLRLGAALLSDVTLANKTGYTEQLRRWNVIIPNDTVIVRPVQVGGSYVIQRSTFLPIFNGGRRP
jgi:ribosome-binding protein aMBF1 (putative translation factor)